MIQFINLIATIYYIILDFCSPDDTIGDLKKLIAAKTGTPAEKIVLKKW